MTKKNLKIICNHPVILNCKEQQAKKNELFKINKLRLFEVISSSANYQIFSCQ